MDHLERKVMFIAQPSSTAFVPLANSLATPAHPKAAVMATSGHGSQSAGRLIPLAAGALVGLAKGHAHTKRSLQARARSSQIQTSMDYHADVSQYEGRWSVDFHKGRLEDQFVAFDLVGEDGRLGVNLFQGNELDISSSDIQFTKQYKGFVITLNHRNPLDVVRVEVNDAQEVLSNGITSARIIEQGILVGEATIRKIM